MRPQPFILTGQGLKFFFNLLGVGALFLQDNGIDSAAIDGRKGLEEMLAIDDRVVERSGKFVDRFHPEFIGETELPFILL